MADEILVIEPELSTAAYWQELWRYRGLLYFLAWRDLLVRYKQTVIGVAWAILPALATTGIFSLVFGRWANLPSHGVPYPLLVMTAALPWTLVSNALSQGGNSVINSAALVGKVYFPRLLIPLSSLAVCLTDFACAFLILLAGLAWYHVPLSWRFCVVPGLIFWAMAAAFGLVAWLASLNVRYRDVRYVIPFLTQFGLYVSPVGFTSSIVPERWHWLYALNPLVGIIEGFRWALLGQPVAVRPSAIGVSLGLTLVLLVGGIAYFRRSEVSFADVI